MSKLANAPTNTELTHSIDKEINTISKIESDPSTTYKGERICEDVKRVLEDQKQLIREKNSGEHIQQLFRDSYYLALGLSNDDRFKSLFENWGSILASVSKSSDWTDIARSVGSLAVDLRETESFVRLLVELREITKLLVAETADKASTGVEKAVDSATEKVEKAVDKAKDHDLIARDTKENVEDKTAVASEKTSNAADKARSLVHSVTGISSSSSPISSEKYSKDKEKERKRIIKNLNLTLKALAENPTWKTLIAKAENAGQAVGSASSVTADAVAQTIRENPQAQAVIQDIQGALQDIVGRDVDVKPFFDYTRLSIEFILHDPSYGTLAKDSRDLLTKIVEQPDSISKEEVKEKLRTLWSRIEDKLEQINNNGYIQLARKESDKIMSAIRNDPTSAKLLHDVGTLINHLRAAKTGEVWDPALIQQVRIHLVPLILEHLTDIPVPGFSAVEDTALGKFEFAVKNINISAKKLVPENIHVKFKYNLDAHPMTLSYDNQSVLVILEANDIQVSVKDIEWSYKRLSSPHVNDSGLASLETDGKGLNIKIKMEVDNLSHTHTTYDGTVVENKEAIKVLRSWVNIDKINLSFKESKHDKMYEVLFTSRIKKQIEDMLVSKMGNFASILNHQLYVLYNEALISKEQATDWAASNKGEVIGNITDKLSHLTPTGIIKDQLKDSLSSSGLLGSSLKEGIKESIKETVSGSSESHKSEYKESSSEKGAEKTYSEDGKPVYHVVVKPTV